MTPFNLTVKNYRCFTEEHPLRMSIGPGFTAFIGPNNSGKSSALRFFFEFRPLFTGLRKAADLPTILRSERYGFGHVGPHPHDRFTNRNDRDIEISFDFSAGKAQTDYLKTLVLQESRAAPGNYRISFRISDGRKYSGPLSQASVPAPSLFRVAQDSPFDVGSFREVMTILADSMFVGAFRNAINEGAGNYFDLQIGTGFVKQWNGWRAGAARQERDRALDVTEAIRDIFGYKNLEINASATDQNLVITVDRRSLMLDELGSGLAQFIVVIGNVAIRKPRLILVDEPELNLHPALQQKFLFELARHASDAVIYASHSIGLVRATSTRTLSFQARDGHIEVRPFDGLKNLAEFLGEMSFSSLREIGIDRVLLIEGVSDAPVFRAFLRLLGSEQRTLCLPLGGSQMIRSGVVRELEEVKRIAPQVVAVIDSERTGQGMSITSERSSFAEECRKVGIPVLITERRATENYLSERAIRQLWGASQRAFGPYEARDDVKPSWPKEDNWRAADVMTKEEIADTDLGRFLSTL